MTDKEFDLLKTELLSRTQTPFGAAKWLKGENGIARITIPREDVSLVLYSNRDIGGGISSYEVVHQIAKQRSSADGRDRRFDVTLLINGLPIVQIELKQVTAKDGYKKTKSLCLLIIWMSIHLLEREWIMSRRFKR